MKELPFVKPEQGMLARQMEATLQVLPEDAGLLFVSVAVSPTLAGDAPKFSVVVGCKRAVDPDAIRHLILLELVRLSGDAQLEVSVFRGVSTSA